MEKRFLKKIALATAFLGLFGVRDPVNPHSFRPTYRQLSTPLLGELKVLSSQGKLRDC
jgi:hypothetical protein